jgi:hypothetical protein
MTAHHRQFGWNFTLEKSQVNEENFAFPQPIFIPPS